jgi:hypothetical protein
LFDCFDPGQICRAGFPVTTSSPADFAGIAGWNHAGLRLRTQEN